MSINRPSRVRLWFAVVAASAVLADVVALGLSAAHTGGPADDSCNSLPGSSVAANLSATVPLRVEGNCGGGDAGGVAPSTIRSVQIDSVEFSRPGQVPAQN